MYGHCAFDTPKVDFSGDLVDGDRVVFDLEILCTFVKSRMCRSGNNPMKQGRVNCHETQHKNETGHRTSQAQ